MSTFLRYLLQLILGDDWSNSRFGVAMGVIMPSLIHYIQPLPTPQSSQDGTGKACDRKNNPMGNGVGKIAILRSLPRYNNTASVDPRFGIVGQNMAFCTPLEAFANNVERQFGVPLHGDGLLAMSAKLQDEFREKLADSPCSMLPSYQHTLPTGNEIGDYLAIDVGGSTLRLALIQLRGRRKSEGQKPSSPQLQARRIKSFVINEPIRALRGRLFFDWMAARIEEMLTNAGLKPTADAPLKMGLAWSFPVDQTGPRSGRLLGMGKGFLADQGLEHEDLGRLVERACAARGVAVEMWAIVNDGAATLLAKAYHDSTTRLSLILGTGMNAAVYLPVSALSSGKFGTRPAEWHAVAQRVVVNTELSMFGKHVLPTNRWDDALNAAHIRRDYQPLEYLVTGRYLGEIVRLVLLDAVRDAGLFHGHLPAHLNEPYALETRLVSQFESDGDLAGAGAAFLAAHPLPSSAPAATAADWAFLRTLARLVARRAAAYLGLALHALWAARTAAEGLSPADPAAAITIAADGSMIEKYPGFRTACQAVLDRLCHLSGAPAESGVVAIEMVPESAILGAAVAACCNAEVDSR